MFLKCYVDVDIFITGSNQPSCFYLMSTNLSSVVSVALPVQFQFWFSCISSAMLFRSVPHVGLPVVSLSLEQLFVNSVLMSLVCRIGSDSHMHSSMVNPGVKN